ncbi:MAG: hypothetical protein VW230_00805 [Candidatus Poseidoniales archaeon]
MDPETQRNIVSIVLILFLAVMVWFISKKAMQNRKDVLQKSGPKIAGEDQLEGGARNPQVFEEPDDDALDEMAKLLGEDEENIEQ